MYVRFGVVTVVGRAEGTYCMASEGPSPVAGGPTWGNSPETPPAWVPRQPLRVTSAVRAQRASELWVNQPRWKPSGGFEWPFEAWWGARHSVRRVAAGSLGRGAASEVQKASTGLNAALGTRGCGARARLDWGEFDVEGTCGAAKRPLGDVARPPTSCRGPEQVRTC